MRVIVLQSGSKGNSIYVETENVRLLFDGGISGRVAKERLAQFGVDICSVDALFISHDHYDHVSGAGVINRMYRIPLWVTEPTFKAMERKVGSVYGLYFFKSNTVFPFKDITIEAYPTPHDAVDGVCFAIDDGLTRFGICTDLGHVFHGLPQLIESLDGVLLESNYDPYMLECGNYPYELKQRVSGLHGHLSNADAAQLLLHSGGRLKQIILGHISQNNNTEERVIQTHQSILGPNFRCRLANYYSATDQIVL